MSRKLVLVYRELPCGQLARIEREYDVVLADPRVEAQKDTFFNALPHIHAMIGSSYPVDDALLAMAPLLKVISSISVGVDQFELPALKRRGIVLCHTPGVLTETVADLLFALILAASRRVVELANYVRDGHWESSIDENLYGWDVHGKTLGILGYGRIGRAVAQRGAWGFNMPVLFHTRTPPTNAASNGMPSNGASPTARIRAASLHEVLEQSDFVVVVMPLTEETRGMIGVAEFASMKPGAIFINGARGPIVQEHALLHALDHGSLRAAGLDVFASEPLPADSPLRGHPKILALPHVGSATHETRRAMSEMATTNLLLALEGRTPLAAYTPT